MPSHARVTAGIVVADPEAEADFAPATPVELAVEANVKIHLVSGALGDLDVADHAPGTGQRIFEHGDAQCATGDHGAAVYPGADIAEISLSIATRVGAIDSIPANIQARIDDR